MRAGGRMGAGLRPFRRGSTPTVVGCLGMPELGGWERALLCPLALQAWHSAAAALKCAGLQQPSVACRRHSQQALVAWEAWRRTTVGSCGAWVATGETAMEGCSAAGRDTPA